jgi:sodium-coupled neutral amino acid transporter 11
MSFHPTREAVQKSLGFETADKQPTNIQHYTTTILLFGVILGMSSIIKSLGTVYSVVGGFSATTLSNILPAFAYFITSRVYTNETIIYPTTDTTATQQDEVKTPLLIKSKIIPGSFHSNNSHDDDEELVCLDDLPLLDKSLAPRWWMDIAAGLLIIWGLVVMFLTFSILF